MQIEGNSELHFLKRASLSLKKLHVTEGGGESAFPDRHSPRATSSWEGTRENNQSNVSWLIQPGESMTMRVKSRVKLST